MLELTMYGLIGLAVMLVIAFCFAFADELSPAQGSFSLRLINNKHLNDSQMTETGQTNPRLGRMVQKHG
jgi:hypothetical protein